MMKIQVGVFINFSFISTYFGSDSSRISKVQCFFQDFKRAVISRLLKEKGREQFWPKKGNLRWTRKNLTNGQNFTTFRVNKMFSHKLTHLRHFRWLPDGAGIINYQ
jgi:hypothetical protein